MWWPALCLCAALACSDAGADARLAARAEAERLLPNDASAALHVARSALLDHGPAPSLSLLAARACLALSRRGEAIEYAEKGLAAVDLDEDLEAELDWALGAALMGRYKDLADEADWRAANTALERGTRAGGRRVEAATLLVFLQDMGRHRNDARRTKFAKMVEGLDQGGSAAQKVRAYLDARSR